MNELDIINCLPSFKDSIALDIGAHIGFFSFHLAPKFKVVYAFEPHPDNIYQIDSHATPNTIIIPKVVTAKSGKINLYISSPTGHSVSEKILNIPEGEYNPWKLKPEKYLKVDAISLDDFSKNILRRIAFMKVDVEGAEDTLFEGAKKMIERNKPIILLEVHSYINYSRLTNFFIERNYKIKNIHNWETVTLFYPGHFLLT